jgi:hypothetical protein
LDDGNPDFVPEHDEGDENARSSPSMSGETDKSPGGKNRQPLRRLVDRDMMSSERGLERIGLASAGIGRSGCHNARG